MTHTSFVPCFSVTYDLARQKSKDYSFEVHKSFSTSWTRRLTQPFGLSAVRPLKPASLPGAQRKAPGGGIEQVSIRRAGLGSPTGRAISPHRIQVETFHQE